MFDPFEGDIVGYVRFMDDRGIEPRFTDARAFYELLENRLIGPHTSIRLEGIRMIGLRREGTGFVTASGIALDDMDGILDGTWYLERFERSALREIAYHMAAR
jgi:hypothetical protein